VQPTSPFPRFSGSADVSVRRARAGDAAAITRVQLVTWRTAYRSVLPAEVLDNWDEEAATLRWLAAVTSPPTPAHGVLVALDRDDVVGFAAYGPPEIGAGEAEHAAGPTTEVAALLVEPRWGRRGHGSRLLAAVADSARDSGAARLTVWLPEQDRVSADFFESAGWAPDGWVRTLDTGQGPLREVRWHALLEEARG
jgi:GNAT superfamily N-acetyltransferase